MFDIVLLKGRKSCVWKSNTWLHKCMYDNTRVCTHTHIRLCIHTWCAHTQKHAEHMHVYTYNTNARTHTHTCIHKYIHHKCTHTYTHAFIHILASNINSWVYQHSFIFIPVSMSKHFNGQHVQKHQSLKLKKKRCLTAWLPQKTDSIPCWRSYTAEAISFLVILKMGHAKQNCLLLIVLPCSCCNEGKWPST